MTQTTETGTSSFMTVSTIIRNSWEFYKKHFRKLWVLFLLGGIGEARLGYNGSSKSNEGLGNLLATTPGWEIALVVLVLIILFLFFFWSKLALYKALSDTYKGEYAGVATSYKKGIKVFFPYILIAIIVNAAIFGGFIALIMPGVLLSIYLMFSGFELFHRNTRGMDAALSSWEIVKGRWWNTLWAVSLPAISFGLIVIVPSIFAIIIEAMLVVNMGVNAATIALGVIIGIPILLISFMFLQPITVIIGFEVYQHLLATYIPKENVDAKRKSRKNKFILFWILAVLSLIPLFLFTKFAYEEGRKAAMLTGKTTVDHVEASVVGSHLIDKDLSIEMDMPKGWSAVKLDVLNDDGTISSIIASQARSRMLITRLNTSDVRKLAPGVSDDEIAETLTRSMIAGTGEQLTQAGLQGFGAAALKKQTVGSDTAFTLRDSAADPNDPMKITDVEVWSIFNNNHGYQILSIWPESEYGWAGKPIHDALNSLKIN